MLQSRIKGLRISHDQIKMAQIPSVPKPVKVRILYGFLYAEIRDMYGEIRDLYGYGFGRVQNTYRIRTLYVLVGLRNKLYE